MGERPLHCNIKNPHLLTLTDSKSEFHSGCRVIDITFPNVTNPEVGEIQFKNSYVAYLTVRVKQKPPVDNSGSENPPVTGDIKWKTCIRRMRLMPNPHCEAGSQDYFSISKKHNLYDSSPINLHNRVKFAFELNNLTGIRLILQQPSPVWKDFRLEELKLYRSVETNRPPPLPAWLIEETMNNSGKKKLESTCGNNSHQIMVAPPVVENPSIRGDHPQEYSDMDEHNQETQVMFPQVRKPIPGINSLDAIASSLQQLWALSEEVAANQTNRALGRFDVDGCYEINLLSYT